jgi:hypothetical protein
VNWYTFIWRKQAAKKGSSDIACLHAEEDPWKGNLKEEGKVWSLLRVLPDNTKIIRVANLALQGGGEWATKDLGRFARDRSSRGHASGYGCTSRAFNCFVVSSSVGIFSLKCWREKTLLTHPTAFSLFLSSAPSRSNIYLIWNPSNCSKCLWWVWILIHSKISSEM